ncbi:MAG: cadherin domain-containing protein, partial [Gammaproteobacteria bacterium]
MSFIVTRFFIVFALVLSQNLYAAFSADIETAPKGSVVTLTWSSNAASCSASDSWSGEKSASGSEQITVPEEGWNLFTLNCGADWEYVWIWGTQEVINSNSSDSDTTTTTDATTSSDTTTTTDATTSSDTTTTTDATTSSDTTTSSETGSSTGSNISEDCNCFKIAEGITLFDYPESVIDPEISHQLSYTTIDGTLTANLEDAALDLTNLSKLFTPYLDGLSPKFRLPLENIPASNETGQWRVSLKLFDGEDAVQGPTERLLQTSADLNWSSDGTSVDINIPTQTLTIDYFSSEGQVLERTYQSFSSGTETVVVSNNINLDLTLFDLVNPGGLDLTGYMTEGIYFYSIEISSLDNNSFDFSAFRDINDNPVSVIQGSFNALEDPSTFSSTLEANTSISSGLTGGSTSSNTSASNPSSGSTSSTSNPSSGSPAASNPVSNPPPGFGLESETSDFNLLTSFFSGFVDFFLPTESAPTSISQTSSTSDVGSPTSAAPASSTATSGSQTTSSGSSTSSTSGSQTSTSSAASTPAASTPAASTPAASTPAASTPAASTPAATTPASPPPGLAPDNDLGGDLSPLTSFFGSFFDFNLPFDSSSNTVSEEIIPSQSQTPAASTPAASTPAASTPAASTPAASTPAASTPAASTPAASTPAASTPAASTPAATTPAASTPAASTPAASTPAASTPAATTPAASTPAATTPAASTPAATTPAASPPSADQGAQLTGTIEGGGLFSFFDFFAGFASPSSNTPTTTTPESTPAATTPAASTPAASTPAASTPAASTPAASTPAATTPAASTPAASTPAASTPAATTPAASTPAASTPAASTPAATTPAASTPATSTPSSSTTVAVNNAPVINGFNVEGNLLTGNFFQVSMPENQTLIGTLSVSDPDGDTLTFSFANNGENYFNIDSDGTLSFINPPDYENYVGREAMIYVTDGQETVQLIVNITITDVDEVVAGGSAITLQGTSGDDTFNIENMSGSFVETISAGEGNDTLVINYGGITNLGGFADFYQEDEGAYKLIDPNGGTIIFDGIETIRIADYTYSTIPGKNKIYWNETEKVFYIAYEFDPDGFRAGTPNGEVSGPRAWGQTLGTDDITNNISQSDSLKIRGFNGPDSLGIGSYSSINFGNSAEQILDRSVYSLNVNIDLGGGNDGISNLGFKNGDVINFGPGGDVLRILITGTNGTPFLNSLDLSTVDGGSNGFSDGFNEPVRDTLDFSVLTSSEGLDLHPSFGGAKNFEDVVGTTGNDRITGDSNSNKLEGGPGGDDKIYGYMGDDFLRGGDGVNTLYGGGGNDFLTSGPGENTLDGGSGKDKYNLGTGTDTIVLRSGSGSTDLSEVTLGSFNTFRLAFNNPEVIQLDTVQAFEDGKDLIGLYNIQISDLSITQDGNNTLIRSVSSGEYLLLLLDINVGDISGSDFTSVYEPDSFDQAPLPNQAPTISGLGSSVAVNENQTSVTTVSAADPEGSSLSYSISGSDASSFAIDNNGVITFNSAPDYETKSSYTLTISVSDGTDSVSQNLIININNLNDNNPIISNLASSVSVAENQTSVTSVSASDADGGTLTYSLSGTDAGSLSISSSGVITFNSAPDYETKTSYLVTVEVTDGSSTASQALTINITDVDDAPNSAPIISGLTSSISIAENTSSAVTTVSASDADGDSLTYSLSGTDAGSLSISSSGVITFNSSPDYETKTSYAITVNVSDGTATASQNISINITDVDDSPNSLPSITVSSSVAVNENQTSALTASASDADGDSLTYSLSGTDAGSLSISSSGVITFNSAPDYETKTSYSVNVVVSDGTGSSSQGVTININNLNDNNPIISNLASSVSVAENQTSVTSVSASDADGGTLTYSLSGTDAGSLSISSSGVITFNSAPDYETKTSYSVTVEVTDGSSTASQALTINITDVDETPNTAPSISSGSSVSVAENQTAVLTVSASDADGDSLTYSLSGTDAGSLSISSSGVITFNSAPDYETKTSYSTTITV